MNEDSSSDKENEKANDSVKMVAKGGFFCKCSICKEQAREKPLHQISTQIIDLERYEVDGRKYSFA